MPVDGAIVERLLAHNAWATRLLLERCATLPAGQFETAFEIGPGSLHDTLLHVTGAMRRWSDRIRDREIRPSVEEEERTWTPREILALLAQTTAELEEAVRASGAGLLHPRHGHRSRADPRRAPPGPGPEHPAPPRRDRPARPRRDHVGAGGLAPLRRGGGEVACAERPRRFRYNAVVRAGRGRGERPLRRPVEPDPVRTGVGNANSLPEAGRSSVIRRWLAHDSAQARTGS